jgi:hypothetical protein
MSSVKTWYLPCSMISGNLLSSPAASFAAFVANSTLTWRNPQEFLLWDEHAQPIASHARRGVRAVDEDVHEHLGVSILFCTDFKQRAKTDRDLVILIDQDVANGVLASIRTREILYLGGEAINCTDLHKSVVGIFSVLPECLSVEPHAPSVYRRLVELDLDDNAALVRLSCIVDEVDQDLGALADDMFVDMDLNDTMDVIVKEDDVRA